MSNSKFAAIHGGLLARKGQASPAMPLTQIDVAARDILPLAESSPADEQWQNIRSRLDLPSAPKGEGRAEPTVGPDVAQPTKSANFQPPKITPVMEAGTAVSCAPAPAVARTPNYRVTLRITAGQRRRLRIIAAQLEKPNQQIMSDALDMYLDHLRENEMKGCACLKQQLRK